MRSLHTTLTGAALLACAAGVAMAQPQLVPLFPAATPASADAQFAGRQGFVRVINHDQEAGEVRIEAIDDAGARRGPTSLTLNAGQTVHFNSRHLQEGNPAVGLQGLGAPSAGAENWRLLLDSTLDIEVLAYLRTADGFLTAMHDLAPSSGGGWHIAFFNPARNVNQRSLLRLINTRAEPAAVSIAGTDDAGNAGETVRLTIPPNTARTYSAQDLERGHAQLDGALGSGQGKWRLAVNADAQLHAMSLLESPTGHLTNLSSLPPSPTADGDELVYRVAYFPPAGLARQGFLRIINDGGDATVAIRAVDAQGQPGEATLRIGAGQTVHFNSDDLERGSPGKGLAPGVGAGIGPWRLELRTTQALGVLPYIRTSDGFLTSMADVAPSARSRHRVATFNPARNVNQVSQLHLANRTSEDAAVVISGVDDGGQASGTVRLTLPAGGARTLSAQALERGIGVAGGLGEGRGKWQLTVAADREIGVQSLLASPAGHLTNLSSAVDRSARAFFYAHIAAQVVEARCANCHIADGLAEATRLRVLPGPNMAANNHQAFRRFVDTVPDGDSRILEKVQGQAGHGGGVQLPAGSTDFRNMQTYLGRLVAESPPALPPAASVPLVDAIPQQGIDVDASTRSFHIAHAETVDGATYGYGGQCRPSGYALRRDLEDLSPGQPAVVVDHRLRCELAPMRSYRVWADAVGEDGGYQQAELAFTTGADQGPPALTVRDAVPIPRDNVDDLFVLYVFEALLDDIAPSLGAVAEALINETARRTWRNIRDPDARYDVVTESVAYVSRDPLGARSNLTGLIARPVVADVADFVPRSRVLVLSHATGSTPSAMELSDAWYVVAAMFAGRGYLVIAPDNWGRGDLAPDGQPETYLLANRTANNSLDLLAAVLADEDYGHLHAAADGKTDVAFVGYSQGGHSAMALWLASLGGEQPWRVREVYSGGAPHNLYRTFKGALEHFAGDCDSNDWCRNVQADVALPYATGRIIPSILAYQTTGVTEGDVLDGNAFKPTFLAGMLGDDANYDALKITLQRNGFTNLVGLDRFASDATAIHLYHSPFDYLVSVGNTQDLTAVLDPHFDVTFHRGECASDTYGTLRELVPRAGFIHALCGMEMLDDVLQVLR